VKAIGQGLGPWVLGGIGGIWKISDYEKGLTLNILFGRYWTGIGLQQGILGIDWRSKVGILVCWTKFQSF